MILSGGDLFRNYQKKAAFFEEHRFCLPSPPILRPRLPLLKLLQDLIAENYQAVG